MRLIEAISFAGVFICSHGESSYMTGTFLERSLALNCHGGTLVVFAREG